MGKFFIKDALDRGEITFETPECEAPNYYVEVTIRDPEDNAEDAMYGCVKVPLKDLINAIEWCMPTEFSGKLKHDSKDPLAGVINKSIELAEESAKLYHLDERQTRMLADEIRFRTIGDAVRIKCGNLVEKKEGE